MPDSVAGVVLAAGAGTRLAPLTRLRPKALCPVGNEALVDRAVALVRSAASGVAVNAHHGHRELAEHFEGTDVHVSVEQPHLLGTAGALGRLHSWIDGRDVVAVNADAVHGCDLDLYVSCWDRARIELVVAASEPVAFGPRLRLVAALLPWWSVRRLPAEPAGLYDSCWAPAAAAGRLLVRHGYDGAWCDAGTPAGYLAANLLTSGGENVVAADADVRGRITRSVVWPRSTVAPGEELVDAVRAEHLTVLVR